MDAQLIHPHMDMLFSASTGQYTTSRVKLKAREPNVATSFYLFVFFYNYKTKTSTTTKKG